MSSMECCRYARFAVNLSHPRPWSWKPLLFVLPPSHLAAGLAGPQASLADELIQLRGVELLVVQVCCVGRETRLPSGNVCDGTVGFACCGMMSGVLARAVLPSCQFRCRFVCRKALQILRFLRDRPRIGIVGQGGKRRLVWFVQNVAIAWF